LRARSWATGLGWTRSFTGLGWTRSFSSEFSLLAQRTRKQAEAHRVAWMSLTCLVVYLGIGTIYFTTTHNWTLLEALYFGVVVVTTVGYGDLLPDNDRSKIFVCFYALFGIVLGSCAIARLINVVMWKAHERRKKKKHGIFDTRLRAKRRLKRCAQASAFSAFTVLVGTLVYGLGMNWEQHGFDGDRMVNGFYLTVMTLTTIGFGDIHPVDPGFRTFTILLMLCGIPLFGYFLGTFTELIFGPRRDKVELNLVEGGLSPSKFFRLKEFNRNFHRVGGKKENDSSIDRFEFLSFLLVANGIIEMDTIAEAMTNFESLDKAKTGQLTLQDLEVVEVSPEIERSSGMRCTLVMKTPSDKIQHGETE